jgi:hypothetical protein
MRATWVSTFGIDHPNLKQNGMPEMRGFDGAPVFFLFNEKLLFPAMRTDEMLSESRFDNLNRRGFRHSAFLLFLKKTLSCQEYKSPLLYQQNRERVENSG